MRFKIAFVLFLLVVFGAYWLYKSWNFLEGPKIFIESPKNYQTVSDSYLEITGKAKNIAMLYLNGRQIFTDETGFFKEGLLLARGYNIIEVAGRDKFNRDIKKRLEIVLK